MDICTCITASLCCAPENNTVNQLYFNKIKNFLNVHVLDTPWALGCRDGYNMDVRPKESGPGAGPTVRGQKPQPPEGGTGESWGTELCQGDWRA